MLQVDYRNKEDKAGAQLDNVSSMRMHIQCSRHREYIPELQSADYLAKVCVQ